MTAFTFIDATPESFFSAAEAVIGGQYVGAICRGYVSGSACDLLLERFNRHPELRTRLGDARGKYLGTFHWGKAKTEYLRECEKFRSIVNPFSSEWASAVSQLGTTLEASGTLLRPAVWDGLQVATPLIRSWEGTAGYALIPHEDLSQCTDPIQAGFEIQSAAKSNQVCSLNLCIANSYGGDLQLWNHIPTEIEKGRYGTAVEGGPYPLELVEAADTLVIRIEVGDLYIFNGAHVHAVTASESSRSTISCLLGRVSTREAIIWT